MTTINASTTHTIKKKKAPVSASTKSKASNSNKGGAPPLKAGQLANPSAVAALQGSATKEEQVFEIFQRAVGNPTRNLSTPHAASTTRDRGIAAADLAVASKHLSVAFVLKECGILNILQRNLFPEGIESLITRGGGDDEKSIASSSLKPSTSALSLSSMVDDMASLTTATIADSNASDSKRGKTTPAAAREGCLLILRGLVEIVGKPAEPYIVGAFLAAALDECGSSNSSVREAAEDTVKALVGLANPWSFENVVSPILLQSLNCSEWRIKAAALECLKKAATMAPKQVHLLTPKLIPAMTNQVWDTKAQVSKAARAALLAVCQTNPNQDIKPTLPAVVNAICKPADANKAVSELIGTTFVVPVDASTLAILCPVLARALKEKLAIHKRAACIVISNMSKLVDSPQSVAPFGNLLVPELQKVAENVQFEEIRDESLKALKNLAKALGDQYRAAAAEDGSNDDNNNLAAAAALDEEQAKVEAEQERIKRERDELAAIEAEHRRKEEEERRKFKEAMDAQRRLDELAEEEALAKKAEEQQKKEMQKLSTKSTTGKCQGCGLKKCPKTCMFYGK